MINIATSGVTNIFLGTSGATAVYLGSDLVWSTGGHDYSQDYFTLKALESGDFWWGASNVEYSLNDGNWTTWTATDSANTLSVSTDDKIRFKSSTNTTYSGKIINSTGNFDAEGNTMSLFYGDNFVEKTAFPTNTSSIFYKLFIGTKVINAENLILPATTLANYCYSSMFHNCTTLVNAPNLPATDLATDCYNAMFYGCSGLTAAPALPATTVQNGCYRSMFERCYSLETAPVLPAATLTGNCYYQLFTDCYSLNYVKCLATDLNGSNRRLWLRNVQPTGTFVKAAGMNDWPSGYDGGIPNGWTVVDA